MTQAKPKPIEPAPSEAAAYLLNEVLNWLLEQEAQNIGEQWIAVRGLPAVSDVTVADGVLIR